MVTRSGLVFIGGGDGYFYAFDTKTGKEVWRAKIPYANTANPMTYRTRSGRQFIVMATGTGADNALVAILSRVGFMKRIRLSLMHVASGCSSPPPTVEQRPASAAHVLRRRAAHHRRRQRADRGVGVPRRERPDHAGRQEGRGPAARSALRASISPARPSCPRSSMRTAISVTPTSNATRLPPRTSRGRTSSTTCNRYAYYGIAATLSMGVDRGEIAYELRATPVPGAALFRTAGSGIALPNAGPGAEYRKDAAYGVTTEADARKAVQELAAKKVDIVKIWVDDRDGTVKKLPPPMYRAIIDEAHKNNLRVVAHIFDLADAKELLRAGIDGFAHGVRDVDIDDEFIALMKAAPQRLRDSEPPRPRRRRRRGLGERDGAARGSDARARGAGEAVARAGQANGATCLAYRPATWRSSMPRESSSRTERTPACQSAGPRTSSWRTWSRRA